MLVNGGWQPFSTLENAIATINCSPYVNGAPLGAVVTTPKIAATLSQRLHVNRFGGNPVVCAQGADVLDVIDREKLQANALKIGDRILAGLSTCNQSTILSG